MNADGSGRQNLIKGRVDFPKGPRLSPDGRRIMFYANDEGPAVDSRPGPDSELWIMDTDGGNLRQVTSTDAEEENAVWGLNGIDVV